MQVCRIAAERRDIAFHPVQGGLLVLKPVIAGLAPLRPGVQAGKRQETQRAKAVVEGHDHHAVLLGQHTAVVHASSPGHETAAVYPDHHRQVAGGGGQLRRVDVQVQAVFAALDLTRHLAGHRKQRQHHLRTDTAKLTGVSERTPGRGGLRSLPAQLTHGRGGVGNAEEALDAALLPGAR